MKKIITFLILGLLFCGCSSPKKTNYQKLVDYYTIKKELNSLDEIIGMEALGIESDGLMMNKEMINTGSIGGISKGIIASILHADDPSDFIQLLDQSIQENGALSLDGNLSYANQQVYGIYALYILDSPDLQNAADYLASLIHDNGAFASEWGEDLDITGWCVEALSLVNQERYQTTIDLANSYIDKHLEDDHYNGGYGGNTNTQASVLLGKLASHQEIPQEQIDYFYTFQLEDGSMYYPGNTNKTNDYATSEAAQFLGNYTNGNIYMKAKETYEKNN